MELTRLPSSPRKLHLLDLPAELRFMIYRLVFANIIIRASKIQTSDRVEILNSVTLILPRDSSLCFVCRETYQETISLFWKSAVLDLGGHKSHGIYCFLRHPTFNANNRLQNLRVERCGFPQYLFTTQRRQVGPRIESLRNLHLSMGHRDHLWSLSPKEVLARYFRAWFAVPMVWVMTITARQEWIPPKFEEWRKAAFEAVDELRIGATLTSDDNGALGFSFTLTRLKVLEP